MQGRYGVPRVAFGNGDRPVIGRIDGECPELGRFGCERRNRIVVKSRYCDTRRSGSHSGLRDVHRQRSRFAINRQRQRGGTGFAVRVGRGFQHDVIVRQPGSQHRYRAFVRCQRRTVCRRAAIHLFDRQPFAVGCGRPGPVDVDRARQVVAFSGNLSETLRCDPDIQRDCDGLRFGRLGTGLGFFHADVVEVNAVCLRIFVAELDPGCRSGSLDDERILGPTEMVIHNDRRFGFRTVSDRSAALDRDRERRFRGVLVSRGRGVERSVERYEYRGTLAGVDFRQRGGLQESAQAGLAQFDGAFVTGVDRSGIGVAFFVGNGFDLGIGERKLVIVRAVGLHSRPTVFRIRFHPVLRHPCEIVLEENVTRFMRIGRRVLGQRDDPFGAVLRIVRIARRNGELRGMSLEFGIGRGGKRHVNHLSGRTFFRRYRHPRFIAYGHRPVVGGRNLERQRFALLRGESYRVLAGKPLDGDAGLIAGVLRQLDGLFRVAGVQVVAAVGADGEFTLAGVAVVEIAGHGDLDLLPGLALPGGYDEPAGGLGDLPRRIDLQGEGLRRDGVVEEVHPAIGNARNFQSRRDGRCRSVVGVVVAARSGQQGCSTGEYP